MSVLLTILLTSGKNIEINVVSVEDAIFTFRRLRKHLDHQGATYQIQGEARWHHIA
jgi:hypothetical protein